MDEIDLLLYMPGSFVCRKCHFLLEKRTISVPTGQIGIRKGGEPIDDCPNCAIPLERLTWKEAYEAIAEQAGEINIALAESVQLQSHYASLLNGWDGGKRRTFSCIAEWVERLRENGTIPRVFAKQISTSDSVLRAQIVQALEEFEKGCSNDGHLAARESNWTTFEKPLPENCPECVRAFVSHLKSLVPTSSACACSERHAEVCRRSPEVRPSYCRLSQKHP